MVAKSDPVILLKFITPLIARVEYNVMEKDKKIIAIVITKKSFSSLRAIRYIAIKGPIKLEIPPNIPAIIPMMGLIMISAFGLIIILLLIKLDKEKIMTIKPINKEPNLISIFEIYWAVKIVKGIRVIISGKNLLNVEMLICLFFPSQAWIKLEVRIGTIIRAIAVGRSKTVTRIGTAKRGRPIPNAPLTIPAKRSVKRQIIKIKGVNSIKSKIVIY